MPQRGELQPAMSRSRCLGSEGGHALAGVFSGGANPAGHLPLSIFEDNKNATSLDKNARPVTRDRWHGQSLLDRLNVKAAFPLGFGVSNTTLSLADLAVKDSSASDEIDIGVHVKNAGHCAGRCVSQASGATKIPERPRRVVLDFDVVDHETGETKTYSFGPSIRPLQKWDNDSWFSWASEVEIQVSEHAGAPNSVATEIHL